MPFPAMNRWAIFGCPLRGLVELTLNASWVLIAQSFIQIFFDYRLLFEGDRRCMLVDRIEINYPNDLLYDLYLAWMVGHVFELEALNDPAVSRDLIQQTF